MRFRRTAPSVLIGAVAIVVVVVTMISTHLFTGMTAAVEARQFDTMQAIVTFDLASAQDRALARAEMLADLPDLKRKFKAGDRAGLLADYGALFRSQHDKYGVDQLQMQVPPATTFLRFQDPATFGDDVSATRPLVVAVNRDHIARKAPAIGRNGPALYGIVPVTDDAGGYIGSLEVGMNIGAVLDSLKAAYGLELALLIDEEKLRRLAPGIDKAVLDDRNRVGKYLKVHATHWEPLQVLATSRDLVGLTEPRRYVRTAMGVPYGVLLVPIYNAAGEPLGVIVAGTSFESSRQGAARSLVWQGLLALFAIVLLAGVILVVIRGHLQALEAERAAAAPPSAGGEA